MSMQNDLGEDWSVQLKQFYRGLATENWDLPVSCIPRSLEDKFSPPKEDRDGLSLPLHCRSLTGSQLFHLRFSFFLFSSILYLKKKPHYIPSINSTYHADPQIKSPDKIEICEQHGLTHKIMSRPPLNICFSSLEIIYTNYLIVIWWCQYQMLFSY